MGTTPNPSEMDIEEWLVDLLAVATRESQVVTLKQVKAKARSEGYRAGIEAAAKVAEEFQTVEGEPSLLMTNLATAIRRLAEERPARK